MLLSVTSRPGISTFGYNKNNKKLTLEQCQCWGYRTSVHSEVQPYVSLSQQMAPPSPSNSTPNNSSGSNGNDQLSKTNLYIRGLQPGTTDQDLVKLCQSMESTEKCEAIITHFNGKYIKTPAGVPAPSDPLLCKFADGGPKKRQNQGKYMQNGRAWPRNGDMGGMALTYDPTTALQNGFYPAPYNINPNRMLTQSALSPYLPSPVSSYQRISQTSPLQVPNPSWMHPQSYLVQPPGSVLPPGMDHPIPLQPASMMGPLTQQLGHLSLSSPVRASGRPRARSLPLPVHPRAFFQCCIRGEQRPADSSASGGSLRPRALLFPVQQVAVWSGREPAMSLRCAWTGGLLERLMLPNSRGLTGITAPLWALLRTNTWAAFFTGLVLEKEISALAPSASASIPGAAGGGGGNCNFVCVLHSRRSKELFSFFCKESFIFCF
ncbi:RNA-binding motif, single-stranded-interacting protein 2 isoform X4 [Mustela putorius furo]|uniref:RNA-binding motif, single-stranded-interacting protein 2 isoform X4 n=1 Tax=Mustela putorius furo TaxID=9669 RepID=A0A8U0UUE1_MUSPF|nr:RNA-binding motif, single-stranded-interacting protein 2 isoform X4 [Mustela putorius furo]